jgi:VWFA-related protein
MLGSLACGAVLAAQLPVPPAAPPAPTLDVSAVDRDGRPLDLLTPGDLSITIDGASRRVLWVRRVSRGPGATADAAARALRPLPPAMSLAVEPTRTVLVVFDAASVVRGDERDAKAAVSMLLDRLGLGDEVAVMSIPIARTQALEFSTDQPALRDVVAKFSGQAARRSFDAEPGTFVRDADRLSAGNAERERAAAGLERPGREEAASRPIEGAGLPADADADSLPASDSAAVLARVLRSLGGIPGRKVVFVVSGGVPDSASPSVSRAIDAATRVHAVIHVLRVRSDADEIRQARSGLLERLAQAAGGTVVPIDGKAGPRIDRLVGELSASFVVGLEGDGGSTSRAREVRVGSNRRDIVVRAPASWMPSSSVDTDVPARASASPAPDAPTDTRLQYAGSGGVSVVPPDAGPATNDPEFVRAFGRLTDYIDSYVERSAALVAEETFEQKYQSESVRLRSDVLLVKPERSLEWVSFRDVFEVDGFPVREREDRLRRLFIEARPDATEQLDAIKTESARFNIGPVARNINVPYFALKFLSRKNRGRLRYELKGAPTLDDVRTWRIEFTEVAHPTIIRDLANGDMPASGWFLVDQATGAVVQTGLLVQEYGMKATVVVSFTRTGQLGMWVPSELKERYLVSRTNKRPELPSGEHALTGTARYSNFRRFQVKTETNVTIPK